MASALVTNSTSEDLVVDQLMAQNLLKMNEKYKEICDDYERLLQQERTVLQNKTQFFSNMVHEVRTQIVGIDGLVEILEQDRRDLESSEHLRCLKNCTNSLLTLINRFLEYSKLETGKYEYFPQEFNLSEELQNMASLITITAEKKNIEMVLDIYPDVPQLVCGDRLYIRQAITNLLNNAVKFTHSGEIVLRVSVVSRSVDKLCIIQFEISDTGIGIAQDKICNLFQPFVQADNSIQKDYGGTGLGLAITKNLIAAMGGSITAKSAESKGTTFAFTLPLQCDQNTRLLAGNLDAHSLPAVVISDREYESQAIARQLQSFNFTTKICKSAAEAVTHCSQEWQQDEHNHYQGVVVMHARYWNDWLLQLPQTLLPAFTNVLKILLANSSERINLVDHVAKHEISLISRPLKFQQFYKVLVDKFSPQEELPVAAQTFDVVANNMFSTARILVAEDNKVNQLIIQRQFRLLDCKIDVVADGLEALKKISEVQYDFLFIDCNMPNMNGYELVEHLRESERQGKYQYHATCALTADPCVGRKVAEIGFDAYLVKPVNNRQLFDTLCDLSLLRAADGSFLPHLLRFAEQLQRGGEGIVDVMKPDGRAMVHQQTINPTYSNLRNYIMHSDSIELIRPLLANPQEYIACRGAGGENILHMVCRAANKDVLDVLIEMEQKGWQKQLTNTTIHKNGLTNGERSVTLFENGHNPTTSTSSGSIEWTSTDTEGNNCLHYLLSNLNLDKHILFAFLEWFWQIGILASLLKEKNLACETPYHFAVRSKTITELLNFLCEKHIL